MHQCAKDKIAKRKEFGCFFALYCPLVERIYPKRSRQFDPKRLAANNLIFQPSPTEKAIQVQSRQKLVYITGKKALKLTLNFETWSPKQNFVQVQQRTDGSKCVSILFAVIRAKWPSKCQATRDRCKILESVFLEGFEGHGTNHIQKGHQRASSSARFVKAIRRRDTLCGHFMVEEFLVLPNLTNIFCPNWIRRLDELFSDFPAKGPCKSLIEVSV